MSYMLYYIFHNISHITYIHIYWPSEINLASIWNAQSGSSWNQEQSVLFLMILYQSGMTQSGIPIHESKAAWQHPRNLYKLGIVFKQPPRFMVRYFTNSERPLSVH